MMLKAIMPIAEGNAALKNGFIPDKMKQILGEMKAEAAYFIAEDGCRTALIFFDTTDSSQVPAVVEPFFQGLNAFVTLTPAMNADDLAKAGPGIAHALKNYG